MVSNFSLMAAWPKSRETRAAHPARRRPLGRRPASVGERLLGSRVFRQILESDRVNCFASTHLREPLPE